MSGFSKRLTPKQVKALRALTTGQSINSAARDAGCSERQMYRWLADDAFKAELRAWESRMFAALGARLSSMADDALEYLQDVMDNPSERGANVRRLASKDSLDALLRVRSEGALEDRLSALESKVFGENQK